MNNKIRGWFTRGRSIALTLVLIGSALQIYAMVDSSQAYLSRIGIGLLVVGVVVELIGHGIAGNKN